MKRERLFSRPDFIEEEGVRILNGLVQVVLYAPLFRSGMSNWVELRSSKACNR